jgi:hypothetical protein
MVHCLSFSFFVNAQMINCIIFLFIFFLIAFPFHHIGLSGTLRSTNFFPFSFGGAAGLRGTFPGHPRPPSPLLNSPFFWTTRNAHNTTSMGGHPAWDSNPADLAVVSEECRSSSHHPTVSPC